MEEGGGIEPHTRVHLVSTAFGTARQPISGTFQTGLRGVNRTLFSWSQATGLTFQLHADGGHGENRTRIAGVRNQHPPVERHAHKNGASGEN